MDPKTFPFVWAPLNHQMEEFTNNKLDSRRGLLWDPGTGKSKTLIDKMVYLYKMGKIDTVILMAKKGEYTNWKYVELPEHVPNGIRKWRDENDVVQEGPFPDEVPEDWRVIEYDCEVYRSSLKEWEKQKLRDLVKPSHKLRILNINAESMLFEGGQVARAFAKSTRKGLLFGLDESTLAKSHKSARSKEIYRLARMAHYRVIMTGTFSPQSPLDVWGQSLVLGDGILGTTSYYSFKGNYCVEETKYFGKKSFKQVTGAKNLDSLNRIIKTFASIKERHEVVDLPPKVYKKTVVTMTDQQEEAYSTMRDMAFADLGDDVVVDAISAMDVISKMDQIACGQIKTDAGYQIIPNNRLEAVLNGMEASSGKAIIWCNYRGLLEYYYEKIALEYGPDSVGRYYGGVRDDERERTVHEFQNGSHLRWIVANQQSLGYGRTLTRGVENHYVSNGYNLEHRIQSEDRTMRIGQRNSVLYTDYYCRDTVNEKLFVALRKKKNMMAEILGTSLRNWI